MEDGMTKAIRLNRLLYLSSLLALAILLLFNISPSSSVLAAPVLSVVPSYGTVGTSITVTGTIFNSYEGDTIYILFDTIEIGTVTVPPGGSFTITTTIPANASSGTHIIRAKRETTDSTFFITSRFTVDARELSLSIKEGPVGTDVTISGAGFYADKSVNITFASTTTVNIATVTASSSGKFSKTVKIPPCPAGSYKFKATNDVGNTAEAAFKLLPEINLSSNLGAPGEYVTLKGSGFGARVAVRLILGPSDITTIQTDDTGNFETKLLIPELPALTYYLSARDALDNNARVSFTVIAGAFLSGNSGAAGGSVTVTGGGFNAGSEVTVYYDDEPIASATADGNGNFTVIFNIPGGSSGNHTISISDGAVTRYYSYTVESDPPSPPTLFYPQHNAITSAYVDFQWQEVIDPSIPIIYELEISSNRDFNDIVFKKTDITTTHYTLAANEAIPATPEDSVFFWRVAAIDGAGNRGSWSEPFSFYVDIPRAPSLSSPPDGSIVVFPISLHWSAVTSLSGPVSYTIQVSRNLEFTQLLIDEKGIGDTSYSVTEENRRIFNKKIPYYWRVKAIDHAGNAGGWSAAGTFNISPNSFPAWAVWTLTALGAVVLGWLIYRFAKHKSYH